jgi:uncharacterized protein YbaA (DUF1428 family)
MTYVQGFVAAVPTANKQAYIKHATDAVPLFKDFGATRMVECWGDDVPDGKVTDFKRAVKAKDDEVVLFSWIEYPDKGTADAANEKMMSDPRMQEMPEMPFDGQRMIFAGFDPMLDDGSGAKPGYVDGYLVAVPTDGKQAYLELASKMSGVFRDHGATRVVEAWGDNVPEGKVTDFNGAVQKKDDESVVYSWVEWPSKAVRDEGMKKMMEDERMKPSQDAMPFDGQRMVYGGFSPILDK